MVGRDGFAPPVYLTCRVYSAMPSTNCATSPQTPHHIQRQYGVENPLYTMADGQRNPNGEHVYIPLNHSKIFQFMNDSERPQRISKFYLVFKLSKNNQKFYNEQYKDLNPIPSASASVLPLN